MTNRILLDANMLRVSLPGYDVTTANLNQLAFDSRFSGLTFYMKGTGNIGIRGGFTSISFGETLPTIPFLQILFDVNTGGAAGEANRFWNSPFKSTASSGQNKCYAKVYTSKLEVFGNYYFTPADRIDFRYLLFRRNLT